LSILYKNSANLGFRHTALNSSVIARDILVSWAQAQGNVKMICCWSDWHGWVWNNSGVAPGLMTVLTTQQQHEYIGRTWWNIIKHLVIISTKCTIFIHYTHLLHSPTFRCHIHHYQGKHMCPLLKTMLLCGC